MASIDNWAADDKSVTSCALGVASLDLLVNELPSFLFEDFHSVYHEVRAQYRTWIVLEWLTSILGLLLLGVLLKVSYDWVDSAAAAD